MFLRIVRARSAEQSGIKGVKRPFDPNIITLVNKNGRTVVLTVRNRRNYNRLDSNHCQVVGVFFVLQFTLRQKAALCEL